MGQANHWSSSTHRPVRLTPHEHTIVCKRLKRWVDLAVTGYSRAERLSAAEKTCRLLSRFTLWQKPKPLDTVSKRKLLKP